MCDCTYHTPHRMDGPEHCASPEHREDGDAYTGGDNKVDALDGEFKLIPDCRYCHGQCQRGTVQCVRYPGVWSKERTFGCPMCVVLCQTDRRHTWQWGGATYWWREEAGPIVICGEPCPCNDRRCVCTFRHADFRCGKVAEKQTRVCSFVPDQYDNLGLPYWVQYEATVCNTCLEDCYKRPIGRDEQGNARWKQDHVYGRDCGVYHAG